MCLKRDPEFHEFSRNANTSIYLGVVHAGGRRPRAPQEAAGLEFEHEHHDGQVRGARAVGLLRRSCERIFRFARLCFFASIARISLRYVSSMYISDLDFSI